MEKRNLLLVIGFLLVLAVSVFSIIVFSIVKVMNSHQRDDIYKRINEERNVNVEKFDNNDDNLDSNLNNNSNTNLENDNRLLFPTGRIIKKKIRLSNGREIEILYDENLGTPSSKFLERFIK